MTAARFSQFLPSNPGWLIAAAIVAIGLLAWGLRDLRRFSIRRVWAISGVCFDESIRKKVLWLTPLAMIGVIAVAQLQQALDEQDAIRQTIKFCLFAAAIVMVLTSIMLACTNLPKEIESRVIYTIVTKPTTRLELIVGKVMGFARVSATLLIIMGLFTWGYLEIRQRGQLKQVAERLRLGTVSPPEQSRLLHYTQAGLLNARSTWQPEDLQIFGDMPEPGSSRRVIDGDGDFLVGFELDQSQLFPHGPKSGIGENGLVIGVDMDWIRTGEVQDSPDPDQIKQMETEIGPLEPRPPAVNISIANSERYTVISPASLVGGAGVTKLMQHISDWFNDPEHKLPVWNGSKVRLHEPGSGSRAYAWVPSTVAANQMWDPNAQARDQAGRFFYVRVAGVNGNVEYTLGPDAVHVYVPEFYTENGATKIRLTEQVRRLANDRGQPMPIICRGRIGIRGEEELDGGQPQATEGLNPPIATAVYNFRNAPPPQIVNGKIPFELTNLQIQRGGDVEESLDDPTRLSITLRDIPTGRQTPVTVEVETRQTAFFSAPADAVTGGDYQILIQCPNPGHTVGFYPDSLQLVTGRQSFAFNLAKSLAILWLMSLLVIAVAIFCSTFLSWPVAMVLTVILLLGHWGVNQLADVNAPGLGATIVNDFQLGTSDAAFAKVVSSSVDEMSRGLNLFAKGLPDMAQFDAISDFEQSAVIPGRKLTDALQVVGGFGLPAIVLAYLILKRKEVAP